MSIDKLLGNQSIIISLDVDTFLFEQLEKIVHAGFSLVEINTTDEQLLSEAISKYPSIKIGAGGITEIQELESCYRAGVHFATSPGYLPSIGQTATIYSMNYLPGIATISEAMAAISFGYKYVRPFPADLTFCTLLNRVLPDLKLFPAEIELNEAEHYLNLPSVAAVGISNPDSQQFNTLAAIILA